MNKSTFPLNSGKVLGRPIDKILLTLNCFKELCLLTATQQSKKIYKYFIKMEKIIFKYMEEKNKEIIENNNKILKETINKLKLKDKELEAKTTELNNLKNQKYEEQLFQKTLFFGKVLEQK